MSILSIYDCLKSVCTAYYKWAYGDAILNALSTKDGDQNTRINHVYTTLAWGAGDAEFVRDAKKAAVQSLYQKVDREENTAHAQDELLHYCNLVVQLYDPESGLEWNSREAEETSLKQLKHAYPTLKENTIQYVRKHKQVFLDLLKKKGLIENHAGTLVVNGLKFHELSSSDILDLAHTVAKQPYAHFTRLFKDYASAYSDKTDESLLDSPIVHITYPTDKPSSIALDLEREREQFAELGEL